MKVRDYVLSNPHSDLKTVAEETNVDEKLILGFLREKRIRVTDELEGSLKCEKCHKPINTGRLCEDCRKQFLSVIKKYPVENSIEENVESDIVHKTGSHVRNHENATLSRGRR